MRPFARFDEEIASGNVEACHRLLAQLMRELPRAVATELAIAEVERRMEVVERSGNDPALARATCAFLREASKNRIHRSSRARKVVEFDFQGPAAAIGVALDFLWYSVFVTRPKAAAFAARAVGEAISGEVLMRAGIDIEESSEGDKEQALLREAWGALRDRVWDVSPLRLRKWSK